jgi:hypothetical protein
MKSPLLVVGFAVPLLLGGGEALAHGHCGGGHHACANCASSVTGSQRGCTDCGAQAAARPGDCCPGCACGAVASPGGAVTTLEGTIVAVSLREAPRGTAGGVHLALETADGTWMDVRLGPAWFLESKGFELAKGDALRVKGDVVDSDGSSFLVAREIEKGERTLRLRDDGGVPLWAGGPGRR